MAIFPPSVIASNLLLTIADATAYTFGMLHSSVFNVWNRTVSERMKSGYQILPGLVYFSLPFPDVNASNSTRIEQEAEAVLKVRDAFPDASLATPKHLPGAHREPDNVIDALYGLKNPTDTERLKALMARYEALTKADQLPLPAEKAAWKRAAKKV